MFRSAKPKRRDKKASPEQYAFCSRSIALCESLTRRLLTQFISRLVFTLLHGFNRLILTNKKILLSHLFKAVGETLVDFGRTRLGGQMGLITVLHTWNQTLAPLPLPSMIA